MFDAGIAIGFIVTMIALVINIMVICAIISASKSLKEILAILKWFQAIEYRRAYDARNNG